MEGRQHKKYTIHADIIPCPLVIIPSLSPNEKQREEGDDRIRR